MQGLHIDLTYRRLYWCRMNGRICTDAGEGGENAEGTPPRRPPISALIKLGLLLVRRQGRRDITTDDLDAR